MEQNLPWHPEETEACGHCHRDQHRVVKATGVYDACLETQRDNIQQDPLSRNIP